MNQSRRDLLGALGAGAAFMALPVMAGDSLTATLTAANSNQWKSGKDIKPLDIINLVELEQQAAAVIPKAGFDYIYGGTGDEQTLQENRTAFSRAFVDQRVLTGKTVQSLETSILGTKLASPVIITPMGSHAIAHETAESGTAKGAEQAGTLFTASTVSSLNLEQIAAATKADKWFQIYLTQDEGFNRELLQRAKAAGYKAIVFTTDITGSLNRERDRRNGYRHRLSQGNFLDEKGQPRQIQRTFANILSGKNIDFIRQHSGLPIVVKGVTTAADAKVALDYGAAAIQVSNHGGRTLNGAPAAFVSLPVVAKAVSGRVPIIFDSGIRRGLDVFKAIAAGADVVALGRPVLYGLALGGAQGVHSVLQHLNNELRAVMQLAGTANVADIRRTPLLNSEGKPYL